MVQTCSLADSDFLYFCIDNGHKISKSSISGCSRWNRRSSSSRATSLQTSGLRYLLVGARRLTLRQKLQFIDVPNYSKYSLMSLVHKSIYCYTNCSVLVLCLIRAVIACLNINSKHNCFKLSGRYPRRKCTESTLN